MSERTPPDARPRTDPQVEDRTDRAGPRRRTAGARSRAAAYLVDLGLVGGVVGALASRVGRARIGTLVAASALALVGGSLYHVALEGLTGRTVGKAVVGLAVVREDGAACTVRAAAVRTVLRVVDWLPAGYLVGLLAIRRTGRRQRIGDVVAGTVVVEDRTDDRS